MLKSLHNRFWSYIARQVIRRGGIEQAGNLASGKPLKGLAKDLVDLRQRVLETHDWRSARLPKETYSDEGKLFQEAIKLADSEPAAALRLLEAHAGKVSHEDELRAVQAAIAYRRKWDRDAVAFLEAAVDAAKPARTTLYWGPTAIISNSYWSRAMEEAGWKSKTLMWDVMSIFRRDDFDLLIEDVMPSWLVFKDREELLSYRKLPHMLAFLHIIRHASVVHVPATGSFLGMLRFWREETRLFKRAGIKTVLLPYGGDFWCYSRIQDPAVRLGLLVNYPDLAKKESEIHERLTHWQQEADCVLAGFMIDAMGRWDVTTFNFFHIDTRLWQPVQQYSQADGRNAPVSVIHTPNHRGFKGTEFLVRAVEELRSEGLQIELRLLEKMPNSEVRRLMGGSDILAEQFVANGYAMSGMEGMACGLPVLANVGSEYYTRVYRRYSFLNECPILSTNPETLKEDLRVLVTRPKLREELGRAGREYVEKYHSYPAAQYLFGKIYDRILYGKDVNLISLFHPLLSESGRTPPKVRHPLVENRLPSG